MSSMDPLARCTILWIRPIPNQMLCLAGLCALAQPALHDRDYRIVLVRLRLACARLSNLHHGTFYNGCVTWCRSWRDFARYVNFSIESGERRREGVNNGDLLHDIYVTRQHTPVALQKIPDWVLVQRKKGLIEGRGENTTRRNTQKINKTPRKTGICTT